MRVPLRLLLCTLALAPLACAERRRTAGDGPSSHRRRSTAAASSASPSAPAPSRTSRSRSGTRCSARSPQVFVFLGDNIYADTKDMGLMREKYALLGGPARLRQAAQELPVVLATWDDHDYGRNDAGAEYPRRRVAAGCSSTSSSEPQDSPRRSREGVYVVPGVRPAGQAGAGHPARHPLLPQPAAAASPTTPAGTSASTAQHRPGATVLGEAQWAWLAEQLKVPAELRLIGSEHPGGPRGARVRRSGATSPPSAAASSTCSGDTRPAASSSSAATATSAELSQDRTTRDGVGYPLYDLTSSSLNSPSKRPKGDVNRRRVGEASGAENFGMVRIDWGGGNVRRSRW